MSAEFLLLLEFSPNDFWRSRDRYLERRVDLAAFRGTFRPVVAER